MVLFLQIGDGPLIPVKNRAKAIARARHLLRKPQHQGAMCYLVTGRTASEVGRGWGMRRYLEV